MKDCQHSGRCPRHPTLICLWHKTGSWHPLTSCCRETSAPYIGTALKPPKERGQLQQGSWGLDSQRALTKTSGVVSEFEPRTLKCQHFPALQSGALQSNGYGLGQSSCLALQPWLHDAPPMVGGAHTAGPYTGMAPQVHHG